MYAIVDIAGQQYKVQKDQKIFVHRIKGDEGASVDFDKVLLIDNDSSVIVGSPVIEGALVSAKIVGHVKGDKVIVFKKKNRKGYQKSNGHRQYLSQIVIEDILEKGTKPKPAAEKKETQPAAEKKDTKPAAEKQEVKQPAAKETKEAATQPKNVKEEKPKAVAGKKKVTAAKKPAAPRKPAAKKTDSNSKKKDKE